MTVIRITLDTSAVRRLWDKPRQREAILRLVEFSKAGKIELAVTRRIEQDIPNEPLASKISDLPELGISVEPDVMRLGYSRLGMTVLGDRNFDGALDEIQGIARERIKRRQRAEPPDWRDWDHLHAHWAQKRDYFVTCDNGILVVADELKERYGIVALTPEAAVQELNKRLNNGVTP